MQQTDELICANCHNPFSSYKAICSNCGYPVNGSTSEKKTYNVLLIKMKSWMHEAQKGVNSILSFAVIFFIFALVAFAFSFLFHKDFYFAALFYFLLAWCYVILYFLSKKIFYKTVFLAFLLYASHTIYEFSTGMVMPDLSTGTVQDLFQIMFKYTPFVYIVFRLLLFSAFIRGIYFINKIERHPLMYRWLRKEAGEATV